jgi:hypothetical protein
MAKLTDRDLLADALGALTGAREPAAVHTDRDLLTGVLGALEAQGCQYDFCPGPHRQPRNYGSKRSNEFEATCYVCREVWRIRRHLGLPPADWHPGPAVMSCVRVVA